MRSGRLRRRKWQDGLLGGVDEEERWCRYDMDEGGRETSVGHKGSGIIPPMIDVMFIELLYKLTARSSRAMNNAFVFWA